MLDSLWFGCRLIQPDILVFAEWSTHHGAFDSSTAWSFTSVMRERESAFTRRSIRLYPLLYLDESLGVGDEFTSGPASRFRSLRRHDDDAVSDL